MGSIGSIPDLRAALWRKAWLIALVLAVGLTAVFLFVMSRPSLYDATAVIQIEAPQVTVSTSGQVHGLTADGQLDLITQNLMARDNMERMIADYALFRRLDSRTERVAALRESITIIKLIDAGQSWRPDVQPTGLSITVRLESADKAATVANALLDSIIHEARTRAEDRATHTLEFLTGEEARVSAEIDRIEAEIASFRTTNIDSLPEGLTAQRDRLNRLTETRLSLEQQRIELQGSTGRTRIDELAAQDALLAEQITLVDDDITQIEAALAAAPDTERRLGAMMRTLGQLEAQQTVLTTQRTEAATNALLAAREQVARYTVLERAEAPDHPVSMSRTKLFVAGSMAIALMAGVIALSLEVMHPAIRNAGQMERMIGVQPVIVIPNLRSRRTRRRRIISRVLGLGGILAALAAGLTLWGRWGGSFPGFKRHAVMPTAAAGT